MYVCVYVCICMYVYIYIYTHMYIHIYQRGRPCTASSCPGGPARGTARCCSCPPCTLSLIVLLVLSFVVVVEAEVVVVEVVVVVAEVVVVVVGSSSRSSSTPIGEVRPAAHGRDDFAAGDLIIHTCHILPPSEIDLGLFWADFTDSEGRHLFHRIG